LDQLIAAIVAGKYPSPPARDLYYVTVGKPKNPIVKEFIKYILTDGQKFVSDAGYIKFSKEKLNKELEKVK
jgi:phosphate transport system substrate-binding protein